MKGVSRTPIRRFLRRLRRIGNSSGGVTLSKKSRRFIKIAIAFLTLILLLVYFTFSLQPLIIGFAGSAVKNAVTIAINAAVAEKMGSGGLTYDMLVNLEKDDSGGVTAIVANMVNINRLQAELTESITQKVMDSKTSDIYIPLGNMFGNAFLSGRGPRIKFHIISVNSTKASFISSFTSAGINQTRHRILLEANVGVSVLVPGAITTVNVTTEIMVAETVVVGKVPQSYAYFGGNSSEGDENLGAKLQQYQLTR